METFDSQISDCEGGKLLPIPADLHSVYENGPFRTCTVCSTALIAAEEETPVRPPRGEGVIDGGGCLYEIQKVYRGDRVIFEMALCQHCGEQICQEFSEESMEALKGFLLSNFRPSSEACHCHFCGFPRALLKRMTLIGACQHSSLLLPPIILCDKCEEQLQTRISPKTREKQEDFVRLNIPGIPGDVDLSPTLGGVFG